MRALTNIKRKIKRQPTDRQLINLPAIWKVVGTGNCGRTPDGDSQSPESSTRRFLHDFWEVGTELTK